jgi:hypothetical protein
MTTHDWSGLETPGDKKVQVTVRDWDGMKRAVWRSKTGWDIVLREATERLAACAHMTGCPGRPASDSEDDRARAEKEPCLKDCPDLEMRLSMLVIINAARQCAPKIAPRPADAPYFAPTREYFSDVLAALTAAQLELEALKPTDPIQIAVQVVPAVVAPVLPPKESP